ncbi:MAG: hypothetical protein ABJE47_10730 [bacterium]
MKYAQMLVISALIAPPLVAQDAHKHDGMAGMDRGSMVSLKAQREIASVEKSVEPLNSTDAARAAGFHPVFGWIPTMGVHWVNTPRMARGQQVDLKAPSNLMFSRINGRDSLVGAAYAFYSPITDSTRPSLFDGGPTWHEHTQLAPAGQTLVMLHVWFVPSPDGPFAGTNPNLPFWALGLEAPDAARMHDAAYATRIRRATLALAEVADSTSLFPSLAMRADVRAVVVPRRDSIRALIPELRTAQAARDAARFDRAIDRAGAQWDTIYASYVASARTAEGKRRITEHVAMLMSDHGDHEH